MEQHREGDEGDADEAQSRGEPSGEDRRSDADDEDRESERRERESRRQERKEALKSS